MHKRKIKKMLIVAMMVTLAMMSGCKEKDSKDSKEKKSVGYPPTNEIQWSKQKDGKIQIKDKVYRLPIDYTELEKIEGFELENKDAHNELYGKSAKLDDEKVDSDEDFYGSYSKSTHDYIKANIDGVHMVIGITSKEYPYAYTNEQFKLEDAIVDSISVVAENNITQENNFIYIFNGISLADTKESVLIKTENPNEHNIDNEEYIKCENTTNEELVDVRIKFENYESVKAMEIGVCSDPMVQSWGRMLEVKHEEKAEELRNKQKK